MITQNISGATYLWNGPGNFKSDQQNPTINGVTQFNAGTYSLVVTLNGCSSKPGYTEVVVNPKLNLPPASTNGPLCEGATLKLISVSAVGATYLWTGPNGFTSTDQNPAITNVTQKNSGIYHLILNVAGCNSPESSVNVAINAAPKTPEINSNDPICEGATLTMSVDNITGSSYNWTGPHGFTYTGNKFSLNNIDTSKSGTYKVIASANGCSSQPAIHSLIINKTPGPVSISSNAPVCEGTTLILNSNAPSNAEFSWSGPNYFKSELANPVINNAVANNAGMYKLLIKINGCMGNENNINVSIKPAPQKPVASSLGKLCEGDIIKLNASGNPNTNYKWNGPAGFVSDLQNPTIGNAKMNNNGMYKVYVIDNGCLSLTDSVAIVINPSPTAPIAKSNAPLCDGNTLYLSVDQGQNSIYSWSGPNGFSSTLANPFIAVANKNAAGTYKVLATKNGCTSPQTVINVQINELPVISSISNNGPLCNGNELILSTSSIIGSQYKWIGPAGFTADVPSPHIPGSNTANKGNYQLTVTRDGCASKPANTIVDIREAIKVSAGPDQTFCNNAGIINTAASITGQSNILWTTSGSGTFSPNNSTVNALYVLSASDRQLNSIKLRIKSTDSSACPSVSSTMNINLTGKPVVKAGVDLTICSDIASVPMNANSTANKLYWSTNGDGKFLPDSLSLNPQYIPGTRDRNGAIINLKLSSAATSTCPSVGDGIKLTINPSPIIKIGSDIEILENEFSTLHPQIKGNIISYLWTPGQNMDNPNIKEPVIKGINDQQYKLTIKDAKGCLASDKIMINVLKPIVIPNTFTPNGDGINDKWMVDFLHQYKNARVQIFNRYGQLVFESKGYNSPWDGTFKGQPVPFGTYYYIIEIGHGKPGVKGYVTVIR
ncbi:MAG: hypothetical protein NVSMB45_08460 [Ginsengibacter sp.]